MQWCNRHVLSQVVLRSLFILFSNLLLYLDRYQLLFDSCQQQNISQRNQDGLASAIWIPPLDTACLPDTALLRLDALLFNLGLTFRRATFWAGETARFVVGAGELV